MGKPPDDRPISKIISLEEGRAMLSEESRKECDAIERLKPALKKQNLEFLRSAESMILAGGLTEIHADAIKAMIRSFSFESDDHDLHYDFSRGIIQMGSMELFWTLDCLDSDVLEARLNSELIALSVMPLKRLKSK